MREVQTRTIGDTTYTIGQWSATKSNKMFRRLMGYAAPLLNLVPETSLRGLLDAKVSGFMMAQGAQDFFAKVPEDEWDATTKAILEGVLANNGALLPQFDAHFQGRLLTLYKVLWAVLQVQYSDFLPGAIGMLASRPMASASPTSSN